MSEDALEWMRGGGGSADMGASCRGGSILQPIAGACSRNHQVRKKVCGTWYSHFSFPSSCNIVHKSRLQDSWFPADVKCEWWVFPR